MTKFEVLEELLIDWNMKKIQEIIEIIDLILKRRIFGVKV